jgi:hypothetical protein
MKMDPRDIHHVFQYRHILVTDTALPISNFDEESLSLLGPLQQNYLFQGLSKTPLYLFPR